MVDTGTAVFFSGINDTPKHFSGWDMFRKSWDLF